MLRVDGRRMQQNGSRRNSGAVIRVVMDVDNESLPFIKSAAEQSPAEDT